MTSKGRTGKAFKVGVLSRGIGNFLSQEEHERLVKATHKAITQTSKDFEVQVKLHPREVIGVNTSWDKFLTKGFYLTEDHVYKIFSEVDLVIIMFSSAALDAAVFNIPAIEMYDPDISPALQIKRGENYHTVYELLGLVEKATGEDQIKSKITKVIAGEKFNLKRSESFELLMNRSNNWLDAVNTELFKW